MRKARKIFTATALALLLAGCQAQQGTVQPEPTPAAVQPDAQQAAEPGYLPFAEVQADAQQAAERLAQGGYDNLKGEIEPRVPEAAPFATLRVTFPQQEDNFDEFIADAMDFFLRFQPCTEENVTATIFRGNEPEDYSYAEIQKLNSTAMFDDVWAILYRRADIAAAEMQFTYNRAATWTNRGVIASLNPDLAPNPGIYNYGDEYYDLRMGEAPDGPIELMDGSITLDEAIAVFDREINQEGYFLNANPDMLFEVHGLSICPITDEAQAIKLHTRSTYKGIPHDAFYGGWNSFRPVPNFDEYGGGFDLSNAMMAETGCLDLTIGLSRVCTVEEGKPLEEIYSLGAALDALSERLTSQTTFTVELAEMVYTDAGGWEPGPEDGEFAYGEIDKPVWKIRLFTGRSNARYDYYIDAATGEITAAEEHK